MQSQITLNNQLKISLISKWYQFQFPTQSYFFRIFHDTLFPPKCHLWQKNIRKILVNEFVTQIMITRVLGRSRFSSHQQFFGCQVTLSEDRIS